MTGGQQGNFSALTGQLAGRARVQCGQARPLVLFTGGARAVVLQALPAIRRQLPLAPLLAGSEGEIRTRAKVFGVTVEPVEIFDQERSEDLPVFTTRMLEMRRRKGLTPDAARRELGDPLVHGLMALRTGRVDGLVAGPVNRIRQSLRRVLELIGTGRPEGRVFGLTLIGTGERLILAADTALHLAPDAAQLAQAAVIAADAAEALGIEPRVALLSSSDFGSLRGPGSETVRRAVELIKVRHPDLPADGEMHPDTALVPEYQAERHPHCRIKGDATLLVFPDLQSATLGCQLACRLGNARSAGPFLAGLEKPVNLLPPHAGVEQVFQLAALTAIAACR